MRHEKSQISLKNQRRLIRVITVHMKIVWVLRYPLTAQRRLRTDWTDAKADLTLRFAHSIYFFVMLWLMWLGSITLLQCIPIRAAQMNRRCKEFKLFTVRQNQIIQPGKACAKTKSSQIRSRLARDYVFALFIE